MGAGRGRVEEDEGEKRKTVGEITGQRWRRRDHRAAKSVKSFLLRRAAADCIDSWTTQRCVISLENEPMAAKMLKCYGFFAEVGPCTSIDLLTQVISPETMTKMCAQNMNNHYLQPLHPTLLLFENQYYFHNILLKTHNVLKLILNFTCFFSVNRKFLTLLLVQNSWTYESQALWTLWDFLR